MLKFSVISPDATYQLNTSVDPVNEGQSSTITLTTTGVQEGQSIPYTIGGVGITTDDISGEPLTGNFVVSGGTASKTLNIANDLTTEGQETLTMSLGNGTNVSLAINDTSLAPAAGDAYYDNVTLLMHMDGANNGTTFTDEKGAIPTRMGGSVTSTSQSKFGSSSLLLSSVNDGLIFPSTDAVAFGTGDFTVELWARPTDLTTNTPHGYMLIDTRPTSTNGNYFLTGISSSGNLVVYDGSTSHTGTSQAQINTWHHYAISRKNGQLYLFVNGVKELESTCSVNFLASTIRIGQNAFAGPVPQTNFFGFIDDLRITKGVARYTSNFTIPEAAFPNVKNENIDPFWNNVVLGMHMDGANNGTTFVDVKQKTISVTGNTRMSTSVVKFGTASAYFDGAGDYLSTAAHNDFNFGTGDFTVEMWVNPSSVTGYQSLVAGGTGELFIGLNGGTFEIGKWQIAGIAGSASIITASTWFHLTVSRASGTLRTFINGVLQHTVSDTNSWSYTAGPRIGATTTSSNYSYFSGYIDELRITKGVGRYVTNFTPPTRSFAEMA